MSAPMSAIGRAAYAEERRAIRDDLLAQYRRACEGNALSSEGRKRYGLYAALQAMDVDPDHAVEGTTAYDRHVGQVANEIDVVDVGISPWDGTDRDEYAVRIEANDGADPVTARVYLRVREARELASHLITAARLVEAAWADGGGS